MRQRFFDSTKLITELRKLRPDSRRADAVQMARKLIEIYDTKAIVSPVEIEVLAGVRDPHDPELTEVFLEQFEVIARQHIPPEDWCKRGVSRNTCPSTTETFLAAVEDERAKRTYKPLRNNSVIALSLRSRIACTTNP